jgi:hypothetical protein
VQVNFLKKADVLFISGSTELDCVCDDQVNVIIFIDWLVDHIFLRERKGDVFCLCLCSLILFKVGRYVFLKVTFLLLAFFFDQNISYPTEFSGTIHQMTIQESGRLMIEAKSMSGFVWSRISVRDLALLSVYESWRLKLEDS